MAEGMAESEKVEFTGALGSTLAGRIHHPPGEPRAWALFAHCFTCSKDIKAAVRISNALAQQGIGTLRFDFTGIGESEGDFADTTFSSNIDDLVAAADMMRQRYAAPRVLIGHSLGGAAVLSAAARIDEVAAVSTLGAPYDPAHIRPLIDSQAPNLAHQGEAQVTLAGGRSFRIKQQFLNDLESQRNNRRIAKLDCALLLFHSPQDQIVDIDNAHAIYEAAPHPKSLVALDGASHFLTRREDADYVATVLSAWASRYLPKPNRKTAHGIVQVEGGPYGMTNRVVAGQHIWMADEPESVPGGSDAGPSPYELLLAGLGACTSMTLRMYADRKGWPLERVRVRLRHERIHANDCADCETKESKVDQIHRELHVEGPLDEAQHKRLLEIAERCPVHRTLSTEIKIRTRSI